MHIFILLAVLFFFIIFINLLFILFNISFIYQKINFLILDFETFLLPSLRHTFVPLRLLGRVAGIAGIAHVPALHQRHRTF